MFNRARLKASGYVEIESDSMAEKGKTWTHWGRTWDDSRDRVRGVLQEGESLTLIAKLIRKEEGQLILLDIGSNHNPIPERARNSRDIVVAVGLQEWRRTPTGDIDVEKVRQDEESGFFLITGCIGAPETFEKISLLMARLYATGRSISPFFNMVAATMDGGWRTLPFYPTSSEVDMRPYILYEQWFGRQIRYVAPYAEVIVDTPVSIARPFMQALADSPRVRVQENMGAVRATSRK